LLHPEDFVDAVMSSIDPLPDTIKVIESTAKGSGNYFHREFEDAMKGIGEYTPVCVTWKEIEKDTIPFSSLEEKEDFARWLWENRTQKEAPNRRSESGEYLWQQWEDGATLEGLNWYVTERRGKSSHDHMASEAPSNWVEAFSATGEELFSREAVEELRAAVRDATHSATTFGYGPRFLHSTGQLHKGGPKVGLFLQIVQDDTKDVSIPGQPFSFSVLKQAQSLGDLQSLTSRRLPVVRVTLGRDAAAGWKALASAVRSAV
jgi:hypothetical protein